MPSPARVDEADPFTDTGRLQRLQHLCDIGGVPGLAMYLFEAGVGFNEAARSFARHHGVLPPLAPFPDLLVDPALWPAD